MQNPPNEGLAEPALLSEPGIRSTLSAILFGRKATVFATATIVVFVAAALFAPWLAPYDPLSQSILATNLGPSWQHWLGTDGLGRDVLSRIIYGAQNSLIFGFLSPLLAAVVGGTLGVLAGFLGGRFDRLVTRIVNMLLAFPEVLLAILIAAILGGGFWGIVIVLTIAFTPGITRVARASTLAVKQEPYIEAAAAAGVRTPIIIVRHVAPNVAAPILTLVTLMVASAIRLEATLSFLGIGTQPPAPSWGNIIREGLTTLFASSWPILSGGLAITLVVLAISLLGDAARDVLDPETAG